VTSSGLPVPRHFHFLPFLLLGALGYWVYTENLKRAEAGECQAKKKVSSKKAAREVGRESSVRAEIYRQQ
jgi:hypothetical protein